MKYIITMAAALCLCTAVAAQQGKTTAAKATKATPAGTGFKKINGISYKITKHVPGNRPKIGDIVEFNLVAKVDTYEIGNTYKKGEPAAAQITKTTDKGDIKAVFRYLGAGEEAIVEISCDTILKMMPPDQVAQATEREPWLKKGKKIVVNISVLAIKTMEAYEQEMKEKQAQDYAKKQERDAKQLPVDDKILTDYFTKNNIKPEKTASGLYYTIQQAGDGPQIASGQSVSIMYTGKLLDGKAFDSNIDTTIGHHGNDPLVFPVGQGQLIQGMDEGVGLLKKGSQATFYIPSTLAYGESSPTEDIAPNSILVFNVVVLDVK